MNITIEKLWYSDRVFNPDYYTLLYDLFYKRLFGIDVR